MEYKVNISGLSGVDLYTDKLSADRLVASIATQREAAPFIKGKQDFFRNELVEVEKINPVTKPVKREKNDC